MTEFEVFVEGLGDPFVENQLLGGVWGCSQVTSTFKAEGYFATCNSPMVEGNRCV